MNKKLVIPVTFLSGLSLYAQDQPNLLIIQTDEQTFRTLGCYRELMSEQEAFPWGKGVCVETPNIDRIGHEGMICTNFYASCPVSTPSRASFQTGLYPIATGCPINDMPMNQNLTTYAQVLQEQGYSTSYVGKWHLGGVPKINRPYFEPGYHFGYMDRRFMFNDGHWKWFEIIGEDNQVKGMNKPSTKNESQFVTDFLTDKCLDILKRDKDKPFYVMLSIPDPHSPDIAREPYLSQYRQLDYKAPSSMPDKRSDMRPNWGRGGFQVFRDKFNADAVANYFAAVKCIDDNVGRILDFLDDNNLTENTIVVFTSDHGDMLYEHGRINKGVPYESSAKIPFVIRYPRKIRSSSINSTPYTTVDFAPTILGLMDSPQIPGVQHGINDSGSFVNGKKHVSGNRTVYVTASPDNFWTMATDGRYKLVLSCKDTPWMFDLKADPGELVNVYDNPRYSDVASRLQEELIRQMVRFNEPALSFKYPYCYSADDTVKFDSSNYEPRPVKQNPLEARIVRMEQICIKPLK